MRRSIPISRSIPVVILPFVIFAELNGIFNGPLHQKSPALFWLVDGLVHCFLPAAAVWFLARYSNIRPASYGLEVPPPLARELAGASLFFGLILFLASFIPQHLVWVLSGYPQPFFSYAAIVPSGLAHGPVVLYLGLTAGLVESAVYIGLPWLLWRQYPAVASRRSLFIWLSSVAFASVHWEQGLHGIVGALVFGLVACSLYFRIGNLWPVVGAHAAVDIVAFW